MAHDVFLSYSTKDKSTAEAVCSILEQNRIRCWIAPRDVTPGRKYAACIIDAVKQSKVMAVIFSRNSNASEQVGSEVECAMKYGVVIIPVRIDDVIPTNEMEYYLSSRHWLDALTPPLEEHIQKLAETVKKFITQDPSTDNKKRAFSESCEEPDKSKASDNIGKPDVSAYQKTESEENHTVDIERQYTELLMEGLKNPDLRDSDMTSNYLKMDPKSPFRKKYHIYAHMCWKLVETIYDSLKDVNGTYVSDETRKPVLVEENKLHFSWFIRNSNLFRQEFKNFVLSTLNRIELIRGNMDGLKDICSRYGSDCPPNKRKSHAQLEALMSKGQYRLYIATHKTFQENIGYAFVYEDKKLQFCWLDFIVIDKRYENAGFGTQLFQKIMESIEGSGMFLEAEIPAEGAQSEAQIRINRFLEKLGAVKLNHDDWPPTEQGSFPKYLYFKSKQQEMKSLSTPYIKDVVLSAYKYIYSYIPGNEEAVGAFKEETSAECKKDTKADDNLLQNNGFYIKLQSYGNLSLTDRIIKSVSLLSSNAKGKFHVLNEGERANLKIAKAIQSYAAIVPGEYALICYDDTFFGGAKNGMLISNKRVFCRNYVEKPWEIDVKSIHEISEVEKYLVLNDRKIEITGTSDRSEIIEFIKFVIFTVKQLEEKAAQSPFQSGKTKETQLDQTVCSMLAGLFVKAITDINVKSRIYYINESKKSDEKFNNALEVYALLGKDEYPMILFDNTSFESAKDGFLITNKAFYGHSMWEPPIRIEIPSIKKIQVSKANLIINDQTISIMLIDSPSRTYFESFLKGVLFALLELYKNSGFLNVLVSKPESILDAYRWEKNSD